MNKPYFCRNFSLTDCCHKRLKNAIYLLLFYGEHFYGFSESGIKKMSNCVKSRQKILENTYE